jgi:hypothetical protein
MGSVMSRYYRLMPCILLDFLQTFVRSMRHPKIDERARCTGSIEVIMHVEIYGIVHGVRSIRARLEAIHDCVNICSSQLG